MTTAQKQARDPFKPPSVEPAPIGASRFWARWEVLLPVALFFALYAATLSRNLSLSHDSVYYINEIDMVGALSFHPHHLLYHTLGAVWVAFWRALGVTADSVTLVSLLNSIFGAATLGLFYLILRRTLRYEPLPALLGTMLPAFSFGFWFYSVVVEVYIIPLFFLVLTLYLLVTRPTSAKLWLAAGLTHGLAVLFHQVHVLFFPVILLAAWSRRGQGVSFWRALGYYFVALLPTIGIPYLLVVFVVQGLRTPAEIWMWVTGYAHNDEYWHSLSAGTVVKAGMGIARTFIGTHFAFAIPAVRDLLESLLQGKWLMDETYLVRGLDQRVATGLLGLWALLFATLAVTALVRLRYWRQVWQEHRLLVSLLALWSGIYSVFFFFWQPSNVEFWIPQSLCWWLLFLALWSVPAQSSRATTSRIPLFAALAVLVFVPNFAGSIRLAQQRENDYYYAKTQALIETAAPDDLVLLGRSWILEAYVQRYTDAEVDSLTGPGSLYEEAEGDGAAFTRRVRGMIDAQLARGGRVLVSGEAVELEPPAVLSLGGDTSAVDALWVDYRDEWQAVGSGISTVYVLE